MEYAECIESDTLLFELPCYFINNDDLISRSLWYHLERRKLHGIIAFAPYLRPLSRHIIHPFSVTVMTIYRMEAATTPQE